MAGRSRTRTVKRRTKPTSRHRSRSVYAKHVGGIRNMLTNTLTGLRLRQPLPDAYRTKVYIEWEALESIAATAGIQFQVYANSPWKPFGVTGNTIGVTACLGVPGTAVAQSIALTQKQPMGLPKLFNTSAGNMIYQRCHVLNSTITIIYTPLAVLDSLDVCVLPQSADDQGPPANIGAVAQAPRAKSKTVIGTNAQQKIVSTLNLPSFFAMAEKDYLSNPAFGIGISASGSIVLPGKMVSEGGTAFWTVMRACLSNAATTAPINCKIMVSYDCIFSELAEVDLPIS